MNNNILFLLLLIAVCCSCKYKNSFDKKKETQAIQALLQQERKAHFDRNVELFISEFADSMISVNKGEVTVASPEENKKRIGSYFGSVTFIKWDDVVEPIIRFSDDGSLAYTIVQKLVILSYPDSRGTTLIDTTSYAWVSTYRKQKDGWKIECNVSTTK
jgi:hypothetical protein